MFGPRISKSGKFLLKPRVRYLGKFAPREINLLYGMHVANLVASVQPIFYAIEDQNLTNDDKVNFCLNVEQLMK